MQCLHNFILVMEFWETVWKLSAFLKRECSGNNSYASPHTYVPFRKFPLLIRAMRVRITAYVRVLLKIPLLIRATRTRHKRVSYFGFVSFWEWHTRSYGISCSLGLYACARCVVYTFRKCTLIPTSMTKLKSEFDLRIGTVYSNLHDIPAFSFETAKEDGPSWPMTYVANCRTSSRWLWTSAGLGDNVFCQSYTEYHIGCHVSLKKFIWVDSVIYFFKCHTRSLAIYDTTNL